MRGKRELLKSGGGGIIEGGVSKGMSIRDKCRNQLGGRSVCNQADPQQEPHFALTSTFLCLFSRASLSKGVSMFSAGM